MRDFIIPIGIGVAVILAWLYIWTLALRAFGFKYFARTPDEIAATRERLIKIGKWRYILMFCVLGWGFAIGLSIAVVDNLQNEHHGLAVFVILLLGTAILGGWWQGARNWNDLVHGEVPFPWLSQK